MDWVGNSGSGSHQITWLAMCLPLDSLEAGESTSKLSHMSGGRIPFLVGLSSSLAMARGLPQFLATWTLLGVAHNMAASFHQNKQM